MLSVKNLVEKVVLGLGGVKEEVLQIWIFYCIE